MNLLSYFSPERLYFVLLWDKTVEINSCHAKMYLSIAWAKHKKETDDDL